MLRTLVVDDEKLARDRLCGFLRGMEDVEVIGEASNGPEAVAMIDDRRPDLVLLDVQMPGLSGIELTARIRTNPELACIKIVILTSKAQATDVASGLAAGADLYLTKPFSPISLLQYVEQSLGV